jgi:hypothetical protein
MSVCVRLGTRGNSKYHYNGVYLKGESPLHALLNHVKTQQGLTYDATGKRGRRMKGKAWGVGMGPKVRNETTTAGAFKKERGEAAAAEMTPKVRVCSTF